MRNLARGAGRQGARACGAAVLAALWLVPATPARAQTPAPAAPPSPELSVPGGPLEAEAAGGQGEDPAPAEPFTYRPGGRRDPFVSLLSRGLEPEAVPAGGAVGLGSLLTDDLSVRGVVESRGEFIAMIQGPDRKTHIARVNDRLLDGVITAITGAGVVIAQEIDDPLSNVRQREVQKNLRSMEDTR